MHCLLRTLIVFGIQASLLLIYVTEAASIFPVMVRETNDSNEECKKAGEICDNNPPCCNPRCRINWGGTWCT